MTLLTTLLCTLSLAATRQEMAPEDALLDRFAGEYEVRVRHWLEAGVLPAVSTASATWKRSDDGRYMTETLRTGAAGDSDEWEAWIGWSPRSKHYRLHDFEVNGLSVMPRGTWDEERSRLTFLRSDAGTQERWEYRFEENGRLVQEVFAREGAGEFRLVADYHYFPIGEGRRSPRAPHRTTLSGKTRVPMIEGFNWAVIDVKINGKGPFRMILDTGAGVTVLNEDLAQELGISSEGTRRIGDPSHPAAHEVDVVTIETIELGAARFEGVAGVAWRGEPLVAMGGIRGVLGFPTFSECLLTLDYPAAAVEIAAGALPEPDGDRVLPMRTSGTPSIPIEVAGVSLEAHIDAGNSASLAVPAKLKERLPIVAGSEGAGSAVRGGTPTTFTTARLDGPVKLGGCEVPAPLVSFDASLLHVNVGHAILSSFSLTFDQKNGRLRVTPPEPGETGKPTSAPRAATQRRMGVQMAMKNGTVFTAAMVMPGSEGERAGLRVGDQLLLVDGEPLTQASLVTALRGTGAFTITVERDGARKTVTLFAER